MFSGTSSGGEDDGTPEAPQSPSEGFSIDNLGMAIQFVTEFNENVAIFEQAINILLQGIAVVQTTSNDVTRNERQIAINTSEIQELLRRINSMGVDTVGVKVETLLGPDGSGLSSDVLSMN